MIIERNKINGSYIITDIKNGYRFKKVYYFYTKEQAVKEFKQALKQII
jgi:hypothetical protein